MWTADLEQKLASLPTQPGVYWMKDANGAILYVGKAKSLRSRVRSYFQEKQPRSPRLRAMVDKVADIDHILTDSEVEALILESHLIKQHRPRYNVKLRDDKRYPYLHLTNERYPRLVVARQVVQDGGQYFGPYTDSGAMRRTERLIRKIFRIRSCAYDLSGDHHVRPCLDHHLGRCDAPCADLISPEEYRTLVQGAARFLEGRQEHLRKELRAAMEEAAANLEFERAAKLRDQWQAVEKVVEKQKIASFSEGDEDYVALARRDDLAAVEIFFVREGKVVGDQHVLLEGGQEEAPADLLSAFLAQYYAEVTQLPDRVLVPEALEEAEVLAAWLTEQRGKKVEVHVPQRGHKRRLLELVAKNAELALEQLQLEQAQQRQWAEQAVVELKERLGLPKNPIRIECYDISTLQGRESVGSMVVFKNGRPSKKDYRRFKIRWDTDHPDDYAMLREVLTRRLNRTLAGDPKFAEWPDLLVVDGGPGQVQVAAQVLAELGIEGVAAAGLAKRFEQVFLPGQTRPVVMDERSRGRQLLQRIRDESHRFANEYHRKLRRETAVRSILDDIPGIGEKRRTQLLAHFESTDAIKNASVEELAAVPGMNREAARAVWEYLQGEEEEGEPEEARGSSEEHGGT